MTLLYQDAGGAAISQERWRQLYRTPGYGDARSHRQGNYEVRLTWVGLASSLEHELTCWLVETLVFHNGSPPRDAAPPAWCATREWAEQEFKRAIEGLADLEERN
jgi:hypothetical protein